MIIIYYDDFNTNKIKMYLFFVTVFLTKLQVKTIF